MEDDLRISAGSTDSGMVDLRMNEKGGMGWSWWLLGALMEKKDR